MRAAGEGTSTNTPVESTAIFGTFLTDRPHRVPEADSPGGRVAESGCALAGSIYRNPVSPEWLVLARIGGEIGVLLTVGLGPGSRLSP